MSDHEVWFETEPGLDTWFDCEQTPEVKTLLDQDLVVSDTQQRTERKAGLVGLPAVFVVLSCIMWTMHSIGLRLKAMGLKWLHVVTAYKAVLLPHWWIQLKHYLWPPPPEPTEHRRSTQKQNLRLLGLKLALIHLAAAPNIKSGGSSVLSIIKQHSKEGVLLTGKLSTGESSAVHQAVAALPALLANSGAVEEDVKMVIVDTGCSVSASGDKGDFVVGSLQPLKEPFELSGISGSLKATHKGMLHYETLLDNGSVQVIETEGVYMPKMECRLFSPQAYAHYRKECHNDSSWQFTQDWSGSVMQFNGSKLSLDLDPRFRLPILKCFKNAMATAEALALVCVTDERNPNLTTLQKKLLQWHFRLGHLSFQNLQWIGRSGWLGPLGEKFGVTTVHPPKCAACQLGKQERTPKQGSTSSRTREGALKTNKLEPGQLVFSDQYESRVPGKVFGRRGAAITKNQYCGGTLFCDAASKRISVHHQISLGAHETVMSKQQFEREALTAGVLVQAYNTDNGVYTAQEFLTELNTKGQGIRHSGVGGHHHNGVAENAIKTVVRTTCTMMIHATLHWPDHADLNLWRLAMNHAVWLHNHTPDQTTKYSPEELWCRDAQKVRTVS